MGLSLKLCCFGVIALVLLPEGESLKCYQCVSGLKGHCDEPLLLNSTEVKIQTCTGKQNACLSLNITSNGFTQIQRECSHDEFCADDARRKRQVTIYSRSCNTCSWSLCNSSPKFVPSFGIGIVSLVLARYSYF